MKSRYSESGRARFAALSSELSRQKSGTRNVMQIISLFGATSRTMRIIIPSERAPPSVVSTCYVRARASRAAGVCAAAAGTHLAHVVFSLIGSQEGVAVHEGKAAALPVRSRKGPRERVCAAACQTTNDLRRKPEGTLRTKELHRASRQIHDDVIEPRRWCDHRIPAIIGARHTATRQRFQKRTSILHVMHQR